MLFVEAMALQTTKGAYEEAAVWLSAYNMPYLSTGDAYHALRFMLNLTMPHNPKGSRQVHP